MINQWGEEINDIPDEGVFDETSLGADVEAATAGMGEGVDGERKVQRLGANRYAVYEGPTVKAATAGMGNNWDQGNWNQGFITPGSTPTERQNIWGSWSQAEDFGGSVDGDWGSWRSDKGGSGGSGGSGFDMDRSRAISGAIGQGIDAAGNIFSGIYRTISGAQDARARREQDTQRFAMQMSMLQQQMNQSSERDRVEMELLLQRAQQAQAADDPMAMMQLMQQMQSYNRPSVLPWVLGGVVVLGLVGTVIYFATKGE